MKLPPGFPVRVGMLFHNIQISNYLVLGKSLYIYTRAAWFKYSVYNEKYKMYFAVSEYETIRIVLRLFLVYNCKLSDKETGFIIHILYKDVFDWLKRVLVNSIEHANHEKPFH